MTKATKFNILASVAFTVIADTRDIDDVPAEAMLAALRQRLRDLEEEYAAGVNVLEAFEDLGDTYEVEEAR